MSPHSASGGGTLFTEPILVVNQKAVLIENRTGFAVFDQHGRPLGAVVETGQTRLRKAIRILTKSDKYRGREFEVRDIGGSVVLKLARPEKLVTARLLVTRADGSPIGEIQRENDFGKIRFEFTANGRRVGALTAESLRAWDFSITDESGGEVARITKAFTETVRESFTTTDNYVVNVHRNVREPLASMVLASALTIDTALTPAAETDRTA